MATDINIIKIQIHFFISPIVQLSRYIFLILRDLELKKTNETVYSYQQSYEC